MWILGDDLIDGLGAVHVIIFILAGLAETGLYEGGHYLIAHLSDGETSAVHLEALAFGAVAARVLVLFGGGDLILEDAATGSSG